MCGANNLALINLPGDGPLLDTWCIWEHLYSTSIFSLVLTTKTRVCWKQEHFPEPPNPCWFTQGWRHGSESRVIIRKPTVFWPGVEVEGMNTWTKKRELFDLKYFWKSLVKVKLTSHHKGPSQSLQQSVCWNPFHCDRMKNQPMGSLNTWYTLCAPFTWHLQGKSMALRLWGSAPGEWSRSSTHPQHRPLWHVGSSVIIFPPLPLRWWGLLGDTQEHKSPTPPFFEVLLYCGPESRSSYPVERKKQSVSVHLHTVICFYSVDCSPFQPIDIFLQ